MAWYNAERIHGTIGYITLNDAEDAFYAALNDHDKAVRLLSLNVFGKPGAIQCACTIELSTKIKASSHSVAKTSNMPLHIPRWPLRT